MTTTAVSATTSETVSATTTETVSATTWVSAGDDESEVLRPVNMVVLLGQQIVLPCSSRADGDSRWDFYAYGDTILPQSLYSGSGVHYITGRRVHVDQSLCRLKTCPVNIASLQVRDAGYYVCFDVSRPDRVGAALVALGINYLHSCEPLSALDSAKNSSVN